MTVLLAAELYAKCRHLKLDGQNREGELLWIGTIEERDNANALEDFILDMEDLKKKK